MENSKPAFTTQKLVQLERVKIQTESISVDGFCLYGDKSALQHMAIFTHGYTADKGQLLNWAARLAEAGFVCLIFDLPGHYLGNFQDVESLDKFFLAGPKLFGAGLKYLQSNFDLPGDAKQVIGGHSLGAFFALKAMEALSPEKCLGIAVGLGLTIKGQHLFETPLYKSTLHLRAQLVSPAIAPEVLLPRLLTEKEQLKVASHKIVMLCGQDDAIVGTEGFEAMEKLLTENANQVIVNRPKHLPHHQPEMAAPHLKALLKSLDFFKA